MVDETNLDLEKELKKFNWGAAYFGLIWALMNGCFKKWFLNSLVVALIATVVAVVLIIVPNFFIPGFAIMAGIFGGFISPFIIILAVFIYIGIKANRWAWESDDLKNLEHFVKIQKRWGIVAGVFIALSVISLCLQFGALYMLSNVPSSEPEVSYISKNACQVIYKKLPTAIKNVNINDEEWVDKVAKELTANDDNMFGYGLDFSKRISISIYDTEKIGGSDKADFDVVKDTPCSISEGNCYLTAKTEDPNMACRFYFDNKGSVSPSEKTKTFLELKK